MHIYLESPIENVASVLFWAGSPECDLLRKVDWWIYTQIAYSERRRTAVGLVSEGQLDMEMLTLKVIERNRSYCMISINALLLHIAVLTAAEISGAEWLC